MKKALLTLLAHIATLAGATAAWPQAVTYEVFVRSFADSDGDGIGDLRGLTGKLDYIRDLGVEAVWLMPIHPSPSYHQYDVTDYKEIHPDYGTMEDFEEFVRQAHLRGLKVVIDLVINHSSREHPWFQAALADASDPHFDYFVWKRRDQIGNLTVIKTGPDSDNTRHWNPAEQHPDMLYYAYFTGGMPDLNYDNPAVRKEIFDVGRFWLGKGVDGFRLDAAKHIFPDDREADNVAFWQEFRKEMRKVNPNILLVGEVWADSRVTRDFLPGLGSVFNFELAGKILDALKSGRGHGLAGWLAGLLDQYRQAAPDFIDATFLANHDQNRVLSELGDERKARVAAAILLTLPGSPYLYYGEEIGMLGSKPDFFIREPMLWQPEPDPTRPHPRRVRHSTDRTVRPVSEQEGDASSYLSHYRGLIHLRNNTPALTHGRHEPIEGLDQGLVAFVRRHADGDVLVLHNVSNKPVTIELPEEWASRRKVLWKSSESITIPEGKIVLPAYASAVLK